MTEEDIIGEVEWIRGQAEKSRRFLKGLEPSVAWLAAAYMRRIDECVMEYSRLADDYVHYKRRVAGQMKRLETSMHETSSSVKEGNGDEEVIDEWLQHGICFQ